MTDDAPQLDAEEMVDLEDVASDIVAEVELRPEWLDRVEIRYASAREVLYRVYHRDQEEPETGYIAI